MEWLLPIGILVILLLFVVSMVRRINHVHEAQFAQPTGETKPVVPALPIVEKRVVGPTAGQLLGEVVQKVYVSHLAPRSKYGIPLALPRRAQSASEAEELVFEEEELVFEEEAEEVLPFLSGNLAKIYEQEVGSPRMQATLRYYIRELCTCTAQNGGIVSRDSFNEKFKEVWRATVWIFLLSGNGLFRRAGLVDQTRLVYAKPEIAIRIFEAWEIGQRSSSDQKEEEMPEYCLQEEDEEETTWRMP